MCKAVNGANGKLNICYAGCRGQNVKSKLPSVCVSAFLQVRSEWIISLDSEVLASRKMLWFYQMTRHIQKPCGCVKAARISE